MSNDYTIQLIYKNKYLFMYIALAIIFQCISYSVYFKYIFVNPPYSYTYYPEFVNKLPLWFAFILGLIYPKMFWVGVLAMTFTCAPLDMIRTNFHIGPDPSLGPFGWFLAMIAYTIYASIGCVIGSLIYVVLMLIAKIKNDWF